MARANKTTIPKENVDEPTPQEEVQQTETTPEVDPVVEVVEPTVEETVEPVVEPTPEPVEVTPVLVTEYDEQLNLAKELNLTVRTNPSTGKPILPSTPAMRAAAARLAVKTVQPTQQLNIEKLVSDEFGEKVLEDVNIKLIISGLSEYVKKMSPSNVIDEDAGGAAQAKLANLYDVALSLEPAVAEMALKIIVTVIKLNLSGTFKPTMSLRFANTMPLNSEHALRFQLLTTLFCALASGVTKKDLGRTLNVRQLIDHLSDRNAKSNLSEFIN